jgi:redox-sensitive bicupin YhaK (pirin superfamily)
MSTASLSNITPSGPVTKVTTKPLENPQFRALERVVLPTNTSDGAGVRLKRSIGGPKIPNLDPFLLLDEFKSDDPKDYEAGFPEHPHRGFETVTIMLHGNFKHQDSKGNTGYLTSGGVQWMTAGKGVLHSETPMQADGLMWGFQLWVNLPAAEKMQEPRYQDIDAKNIPTVELDNGTKVRLIAGDLGGISGPVNGVTIKPTLLDVSLPAGQTFEYPIPDGHTLFLYTIEGKLAVEEATVDPSRIVIFDPKGDSFKVSSTTNSPSRFLVVSGAPLKEPIVRHGPFVMNTREQILQCFQDFYAGDF